MAMLLVLALFCGPLGDGIGEDCQPLGDVPLACDGSSMTYLGDVPFVEQP